MISFHDKYTRTNSWWQSAEFELTQSHRVQTDIVGFLYEDEFVKLDVEGWLEVLEGFHFGASGPTLDTRSSREASCLHDALYHINQRGGFEKTFEGHDTDNRAVREVADMLLYTTAIDNGMWKWRAETWLFFLRKSGGKAWNNKSNK